MTQTGTENTDNITSILSVSVANSDHPVSYNTYSEFTFVNDATFTDMAQLGIECGCLPVQT